MKNFSVSQLQDQLLTYGRTFQYEDILYFNWSGSTVEFCFRGTHLCVKFWADSGCEVDGFPGDPCSLKRETWPWIAIFLDDMREPDQTCQISSHCETFLIFQSEKSEIHKIRLTKLTENSKGFLGISQFLGEGEFLLLEKKKRRRMEIVGDSITCGYGNLSIDPTRHFYSAEENPLRAYGPMAAYSLGMEYSLVSYSGITAVKHPGWMIPYSMDELYTYTDRPLQEKLEMPLEKWDFQKEPSDYIVINLGTNDSFGILFSETAGELERFPAAYEKFLEKVRACNGPDTHIICALGTMNYYLYHDIVQAVEHYCKRTKDEKISILRFRPINPMDGLGADGHPSQKTHKKMANELAYYIRNLEKRKKE